MIDASTFASHHNAFWSNEAPTSEHFVRRLNLEHTERSEPPLQKPISEIRAAFVAELAFSRFCCVSQGLPKGAVHDRALAETRGRLGPLTDDPSELKRPLSDDEQQQVSAFERRFADFFESREGQLVTRPVFQGCGFVDASEGDLISGKTLFEVKAVARTFRSADVRQLLTYCALNHASGQYDLVRMGIYNPRRGLWFEMGIEEVCREIAGVSGSELFDRIAHVLSSGEISR